MGHLSGFRMRIAVFVVIFSAALSASVVNAPCDPDGPPPTCTTAEMLMTDSNIEVCLNSLPRATLKTGEAVLDYAVQCIDKVALRTCKQPSRGDFTIFVGYFLEIIKKFGLDRITYIKPPNQVEDDKECFNILDYHKWVVCHGQFYRFATDTWNGKSPFTGDMAKCFKSNSTSCKCVENCGLPFLQKLVDVIMHAIQYDSDLACAAGSNSYAMRSTRLLKEILRDPKINVTTTTNLTEDSEN